MGSEVIEFSMFYGVLIIFLLSKSLKNSCFMWYKQFESWFAWRHHRWYHRSLSNIQFNKSYKIAVSFKLNNTDFPPLSFPDFSKSCSSVSLSLPYATACNSLSDNVSLSSKHLSSSSNKKVSVFYVGRLLLTKCTFHLNLLCLILFLVSQHSLIIILFVILPCCTYKCKFCTYACACERSLIRFL